MLPENTGFTSKRNSKQVFFVQAGLKRRDNGNLNYINQLFRKKRKLSSTTTCKFYKIRRGYTTKLTIPSFCCVGGLRVPNVPEQFQTFEGKIIHSSSWDNDYDLTNKTVAVIGSGTR
jgi:lysine/ornithine N-monooxygenase